MNQDFLAFCVREQPWLLDLLERLVRLESPSTDKTAADRCGAELERVVRSIGGRVTRFPQREVGDHLRAEFGAGERQILLLTHFDTVWPVGQLERMPLRHESGRLYGPGVYDMKAGIAMAMLAMRALFEGRQPARGRAATSAKADPVGPRVVLLMTSDEETGSMTSRTLIEDEARGSEAVLVLEPSMPETGALKTSRKGCATYELRVHGVAAHAGEPEKGVSALLELAAQLLALDRMEFGPGVSVTASVARAGERTNVVPDEAWAVLDVRVPTLAGAARVETALRSLEPGRPGARLAVTGGVERPPLERTPGVVRLYEMARSVAARMGSVVTEACSGGVSDGNFTAALGVSTLDGLGAVGSGAHGLDEHVVTKALAPRAASLAGLIARIATR